MSYIKTCAVCGTQFESVGKRAKYCSKQCCRKVENRQEIERRKRISTIQKKCEYCGKNFFTYSDKIRFCNKTCAANGRKIAKVADERQYETVRIKIISPLYGVYADLMPKIGSVHMAEKTPITKWSKRPAYISRSIGKHGLLVRQDECIELHEEDVVT